MSEYIEKMLKKRIVITGEGRVSCLLADYIRGQNQQNVVTLLTHQDVRDGAIPDCDYLIAAGAKVFADQSVRDPESYVQSNIIDFYNMMEIVRKRPSKELFVYVSTYEAGQPKSPYAATKAAGEAITSAWGTAYNFPWLVLRSPNLFIPEWDDKGFVGKLLRCEIKEPAYPNRYRQWLDGEEFASRVWNQIQTPPFNRLIEYEGWVYTDQQIADRVEAYKAGVK